MTWKVRCVKYIVPHLVSSMWSRKACALAPGACSLQDITDRFTLKPLLAAPIDQVLARSFDIQASLAALLVAAGRDQVYPGGRGRVS